ncbi:Cuticle protein 10.9, partial [Stegodyphus mimosarum]
MLPLILICLAAIAYGQQQTTLYSTSTASQIESEEENAKTVPVLYSLGQTNYNAYQPAAQQRRPVYTAPRAPETYNYSPYSFNYVAQGEDGSSSRQETGDASGRVVGSYTLAVDDGRRRVVEYIADQDGFRATIDTNEPGTDVQNPADVVFHSAGIGRANQQTQTAYRPSTSYRQRPSRIYSQPNIVRPVYHRADAYYGYHPHDSHAYDQYRHAGHASSYYHDDNRPIGWRIF